MAEQDHVTTIDRATTRRALLAAAAGGAAAIAARAAMPSVALAADPNDLVLNQENDTTADTGVLNGTPDVDAFHGTASGTGAGLVGSSDNGPGVRAGTTGVAAVYAISGDGTGATPVAETGNTGVYGFAPTPSDPNQFGIGVFGDSDDVGVQAIAGAVGVYGAANYGVEGDGYGTGGAGVVGYAAEANTIGVLAQGDNSSRIALRVSGKASFSRSGRTAMAAGTYYKTIYLTGVTTSSLVFAVLTANRSGRWVRAVVPATARFIVYLNTTLTATTYVAWWVIN
jgi:hypothetical protein